MKRGIIRFLILCAVGFCLGGVFAYFEVNSQNAESAINRSTKVLPADTVTTKTVSTLKGDFALVSENGEAVSDDNWSDQYKLVFFGFTHCPDVCPAALSKVSEVLDSLDPEKAEQIVPLFITVDPDRDTPEVMKDYTDAFDERIVGLTGSQEQIDAAVDTYKVYAAKSGMPVEERDSAHDQNAGMYMMEHSAYLYLMAPKDSALVKVMPSDDPVDDIIAKLEAAL